MGATLKSYPKWLDFLLCFEITLDCPKGQLTRSVLGMILHNKRNNSYLLCFVRVGSIKKFKEELISVPVHSHKTGSGMSCVQWRAAEGSLHAALRGSKYVNLADHERRVPP